LAEELRALEPPVDPGFLAAPFRDRCDASVLLERSGGCRAFALFAEGDEEARSEDGTRSWERLEEGEVGVVLGALGDGVVACCDRLQGDAELSDERLDHQGIGGDDALIGGQRCRGFYGLETLGDDVCRAHVMVAEEGLEGWSGVRVVRL
jgi:hypothetical protein